jgi:hypothetical protein
VHVALKFYEFLAMKTITKIDYPPLPPDLAPCNFWLFPKLKSDLKGQIFADIPESNARYS